MTVIGSIHEDHGATFEERGGRRVVAHYGRPERVHKAVRNVVGLIEAAYGVVVVTGEDRVEFVDDAVSNRVPGTDGEGVYTLLLDPQGRVETDMYVYNAGERLLCFTPPERAEWLADDWSEKVFIQDVEVREATADFGVFGIHGPKATEKVASVLNGSATPDHPLSFVRGSVDAGTGESAGVTVIRSDAPTGEEGYEVVCRTDDASEVFATLLNKGLNAAPFGHRTWDALTLEAGTPLFATEIDGAIPNDLGMGNAVDFEKGCFVGQEVVSRIHNRGHPASRLVGLEPDRVPEAGAAVFAGDAAVGQITRAVASPTLDRPVAMATVDHDAPVDLTVRVDAEAVSAERVGLPFVEGSDRSARVPVDR